MQTHTVKLNLAAVTVPVPALQKAKKFVEWGPKHSFPATVLGLIRQSPTASAMIGRKGEYIAGEGLSCSPTAQPELAAWLTQVQAAQLLAPTGADAAHLESYAWQVIWAKDKKSIVEIYHQPVDTVLWGEKNAEGRVETYYLCDDWSKSGTAEFPVVPLPAYDPKKPGGTQLYVFHHYAPGQRYYQDLSFTAGFNDMATEAALTRYRKNSVDTRFGGNTIVSILDGPKDKVDPADPAKTITAAAQREAFKAGVKNTFQGPEADSLLFVFGDGTAEAAAKMVKVQSLSAASPESYEKISDQAIQAILSCGGVTSPAVVGLPTQAGLGGGGSELREAYETYDNAVCLPWRRGIVAGLLELFTAGGRALAEVPDDTEPLAIVAPLPVRQHFGEESLARVLEDDEIRQAEGYAARKKPAEAEGDAPVQTEAQKALSGSVGGQTSIDAMLNLLAQNLTTRASCLARLKTFFGLTPEQAEAIVPLPAETTQVPAGTV
ncbi:hypothetical protein [Hymenobacter sp.]|uniref:hypothetical protein n=1 Tax=Hymenobacter sp. TaxID=1898978 RepID=UPI00286B32EA|nr:hypothetical protein [Hymenobacter sp.]